MPPTAGARDAKPGPAFGLTTARPRTGLSWYKTLKKSAAELLKAESTLNRTLPERNYTDWPPARQGLPPIISPLEPDHATVTA